MAIGTGAAMLGSAAIGFIGNMISGAQQRNADREREEREQRRREDAHEHYNKYAKKQDKWNKKVWEYDKKKLKNNYF